MEQNRTGEERAVASSAESEADMVEMAGETTAAAASDTKSTDDARPVGAGTRVKVEGETDSDQ
jgi:hypothetical protein